MSDSSLAVFKSRAFQAIRVHGIKLFSPGLRVGNVEGLGVGGGGKGKSPSSYTEEKNVLFTCMTCFRGGSRGGVPLGGPPNFIKREKTSRFST